MQSLRWLSLLSHVVAISTPHGPTSLNQALGLQRDPDLIPCFSDYHPVPRSHVHHVRPLRMFAVRKIECAPLMPHSCTVIVRATKATKEYLREGRNRDVCRAFAATLADRVSRGCDRLRVYRGLKNFAGDRLRAVSSRNGARMIRKRRGAGGQFRQRPIAIIGGRNAGREIDDWRPISPRLGIARRARGLGALSHIL
jgi:hypothetical protein